MFFSLWLNGIVEFFEANSPHLVPGAHVGESEKFFRDSFAEAYSHASTGKPSVVFIDELDAICRPRNSR